jgi:hypothetical protein
MLKKKEEEAKINLEFKGKKKSKSKARKVDYAAGTLTRWLLSTEFQKLCYYTESFVFSHRAVVRVISAVTRAYEMFGSQTRACETHFIYPQTPALLTLIEVRQLQKVSIKIANTKKDSYNYNIKPR